MTNPRRSLEDVAGLLRRSGSEALGRIVADRLQGDRVEGLPLLARDEDPADVLVDAHELITRSSPEWSELKSACAELAHRWAGIAAVEIRERPTPLGELHYLCARIGAVEARGPIAFVADRPDLGGVALAGGEPLQGRSLRCLAGLLALVIHEDRQGFLEVFDRALEVPQNVAIALTALAAFDPEHRRDHERKARSRHPQATAEALRHLERNVALLVGHDPDRDPHLLVTAAR